jgi:hypothetical protein
MEEISEGSWGRVSLDQFCLKGVENEENGFILSGDFHDHRVMCFWGFRAFSSV